MPVTFGFMQLFDPTHPEGPTGPPGSPGVPGAQWSFFNIFAQDGINKGKMIVKYNMFLRSKKGLAT